jgi:hypothetical protein
MKEKNVSINVFGHINIKDKNTGEVLKDQDNAIHPQNLARIFARALANENYHHVYDIALGNGGTFVDSTGNVVYNLPNTTGLHAQLYNQTYREIVDGSVANGNTVISAPSATDITSIVTLTATISANEPSDQTISDSQLNGEIVNPSNYASGYKYGFDELGIRTKNPLYTVGSSEPEYLLLTHVVFSEIEKTANRELILTYTLQISVS